MVDFSVAQRIVGHSGVCGDGGWLDSGAMVRLGGSSGVWVQWWCIVEWRGHGGLGER